MCSSSRSRLAILLLLSSLFSLTNTRVIALKCITQLFGANCHPIDKPWQKDGWCLYLKHSGYQRCLAPDTKYLQLSIIARYRSLNLRTAPAVKDMYIRGTGPGLSWEKSLKMSKSATALDVWTLTLSYTVDSDGLPCLSSTHCLLNQQYLEFRIYKDSLGREGMKGPNFFIRLPTISNTIKGAASFRTPSVTVYPWFTGTTITTRFFKMKLSEQILPIINEITLDCWIHFPPSYNENVRKKYPLVIVFETMASATYRPLLELLFVHEASVEEVAVLFVTPKFPLNYTILPFDSYVLDCKTWGCSDCQTCWANNRAEKCDRDEFIDKAKRCLHFQYVTSIGTQLMESAVTEFVRKAQEYLANRILYDPPKHRLTLIGPRDVGVSVFHKALVSPELVQYAASFSPSFFYPLDTNYNLNPRIYQTIEREATKTELDPGRQYLHYSQKFYIDYGENDGFYFPLDDLYIITDKVVQKLKDRLKLETDVNVIQQVFSKTDRLSFIRRHETPGTYHNIRYPLMAFHGVKGGLNKDYVKTIKVSPSFIAERQGSVTTGGDGSVFNVISGNNGTGRVLVQGNNQANCSSSKTKCEKTGMPLGLFIGAVGMSAAMSSIISVILMCLREGSRRAAEKEEKEERELLEELSSDDDLDDL